MMIVYKCPNKDCGRYISAKALVMKLEDETGSEKTARCPHCEAKVYFEYAFIDEEPEKAEFDAEMEALANEEALFDLDYPEEVYDEY